MDIPKPVSVDLVHSGEYLSYYNTDYESDKTPRTKRYEFVSRNPNLSIDTIGKNEKPASIIMLVLPPGDADAILLSHEFRMPLNQTVLSVPSGMIEPGETIEDTCRRELKEETGLDLREIISVLPPSAIAPGITDDLTCLVICTAWGDLKSRNTASERIENFWYTWGAVRNVLQGKDPLKGENPYMICSIQAQMAMLYGLATFENRED